jgi:copper(I)-binding protein
MFNLVKKNTLGYLCIGLLSASSWATSIATETTTTSTQVVKIEQDWVREVPPTVTLTAAYMQITNLTDETLILIGGRSPDFATVEIHQTVFEAGMAKMVPQEQLPIPPHQSIVLKPKGLHIMLIDRQRPLKAGDQVDLTLLFQDNIEQTVTLEVKTAHHQVDGNGMMNHHHH